MGEENKKVKLIKLFSKLKLVYAYAYKSFLISLFQKLILTYGRSLFIKKFIQTRFKSP